MSLIDWHLAGETSHWLTANSRTHVTGRPGWHSTSSWLQLLRVQAWSAVFDEGHKLKNPKAKVYKAVLGLQTPRKFALTGTAMQARTCEQCIYAKLMRNKVDDACNCPGAKSASLRFSLHDD